MQKMRLSQFDKRVLHRHHWAVSKLLQIRRGGRLLICQGGVQGSGAAGTCRQAGGLDADDVDDAGLVMTFGNRQVSGVLIESIGFADGMESDDRYALTQN